MAEDNTCAIVPDPPQLTALVNGTQILLLKKGTASGRRWPDKEFPHSNRLPESVSGGQDDVPTDFSVVPKDHRQHPTAASADPAILSGAAEHPRSTCLHLPLSRDAASAPPAATARTCPWITLHRQTIAATITSTQKRKPTHQRQPVNGRRKNIKHAEATKPITSWVSQF
ncbi:hypothetical protein BGW80DRAFT_1255244 [Lactifluus volemus]|nr:hypothetical protein BGW80DRAFT_1255244 [Lactifluus volemus]